MQQSIEIPQEDFDDMEAVDETKVLEDENEEFNPTQEDMEEVALRALGRMTLQEFIEESISALVEVYKAKPESFAYDAAHYSDEDAHNPNPFIDLIKYLQEVKPDESPRNTNL
jgi:hypothetical protein